MGRRAPAKRRWPICWPRASRSTFRQLSAVASGVKELREALEEARDRLSTSAIKTLLFVDEIHRFNKSQQDVLLPDVEEGIVVLVGATTQNPFFALNSALVSRSRIFQFEPLTVDDIKTLLRRALTDEQRGLGQHGATIDEDALDFLAAVSDGDARRALAALEVGVLSSNERPLRYHPPVGRGVGPAQGHRVRSQRRCPLRRRQRADQEHSRQRSRRGDLLAGPHARSGRGSTVSGSTFGDPGQRGRGQCRSACAAAGGRGDAGLRIRRIAGMSVDAGPGRGLPGLCPEIERGDRGHRRSPGRRGARDA